MKLIAEKGNGLKSIRKLAVTLEKEGLERWRLCFHWEATQNIDDACPGIDG